MPLFPASAIDPMDITGDHHVHTSLCNHAQGAMEEYVEAALRKGLRSITFLEHLECGLQYMPRVWLTPELFQEYFEEGQRLQEKYTGRITIRLGAEIGYNTAAKDELLLILDRFPFAHRGLSCHFYWDGREHLNMLSRREDHIRRLGEIGTERVLNAYFAALIEGCRAIPCDKLCHLDAALRHNKVRLTEHHHELIGQLFTVMQEKKIALEVNTSGYVLRPHPYPAPNFIQQAQQLGIPLIVGSDAHHPDQVGRFFERLTFL